VVERRSLLRDLALLLLAVVTAAAATYVITRQPGADGPASTDRARPSTAASPVAASPQPARLRALFVGGDSLVGSALPAAVGAQLGWDVEVDAVAGSGYVGGPAAQTFPVRLPTALRRARPDVVVIVSSGAPEEETDGRRFGGNVQFVVGAVRTAQPEAEVLLVGPLLTGTEAAPLQRQVLTQVAARFGAVFVDPSGRGYLAGRSGLVDAQGAPTPAGVLEVARRLAEELRRVLPVTLLAGPRPTG
jgi:hypothetical protein